MSQLNIPVLEKEAEALGAQGREIHNGRFGITSTPNPFVHCDMANIEEARSDVEQEFEKLWNLA